MKSEKIFNNECDLDELARQKRNAYFREWREKPGNKEKIKEYSRNYWLKKAMKNS